MTTRDFRLPDLGEGVAEAEIERWLVKEGDEIAQDEPLVEVITDKASVEIPSPFAGEVIRIHVQAGDIVPVGTVLVSIGDPARASTPGGVTDANSPGDEAEIDLRDPGDIRPASGAPAPSRDPHDVTGVPPATAAVPLGPDEGVASSDVKATPPIRKLARSLGVDIDAVTGTGPGGRVLREDVERFVGAGRAAAEPARRQPLRGVRRTIAERMSHAHQVIPPVTHVEECDVTELDATRRLANERSPAGPRLTYLPFIVKAVVIALGDHPALNASLDDEAEEIVLHEACHIGIAVDTPDGLVVPVVRHADGKTLRAIAAEVEDLATRARAGRLHAEELRGGTFTVTSPGAFGGVMATPLILHPQSAILGVHRAMDRPVARDGQVVIRKMMNLSITFDHRILDGMTAARFALDVVGLLEHPAVLALDSE